MNRSWKFLGVFFVAHLVVSVTYYLLAGQPGSGSLGGGGGGAGIPAFGGMLFLLSFGRPMPEVSPPFFILNSLVTASVATGVFIMVRRLRAA